MAQQSAWSRMTTVGNFRHPASERDNPNPSVPKVLEVLRARAGGPTVVDPDERHLGEQGLVNDDHRQGTIQNRLDQGLIPLSAKAG